MDSFFVRNLVENRGLWYQLVRRDFERRFVGSAIGWVWAVIHPSVLLVSWYWVFTVCMGVTLLKTECPRITLCFCLPANCRGCRSATRYIVPHRACSNNAV